MKTKIKQKVLQRQKKYLILENNKMLPDGTEFYVYGNSRNSATHVLLHQENNGQGRVACGRHPRGAEFGSATYKIIGGVLYESSHFKSKKYEYFAYHLPLSTLITCKTCLKQLNGIKIHFEK
jgi:hypothetical protein